MPASPGRAWAEIEQMLRPADASWWPGMTIVEPPRAVAPGEALVLGVRSPLGYRLRVRLEITEVDHGRLVAATSTGDLRGAGRVELAPAGEAASVAFRWDVETERAWMNATAFVLRPLFARAHRTVMARGERGLHAALAGV